MATSGAWFQKLTSHAKRFRDRIEVGGYLVQGLLVGVGKGFETIFAKASAGQRGVRHCYHRTEEGGES